MSQKTVTKQLLINHIDLPYDMQTIIKDYVFLDTASYNNKCKKTIVINEIKNAIVSSLRNIYYPATEPEPEHMDHQLTSASMVYCLLNYWITLHLYTYPSLTTAMRWLHQLMVNR